MLTKSGTAVLGDFGVAIQVPSVKKLFDFVLQMDDEEVKGDSTSNIVGTPYWRKYLRFYFCRKVTN